MQSSCLRFDGPFLAGKKNDCRDKLHVALDTKTPSRSEVNKKTDKGELVDLSAREPKHY